MWYYVSYNNLVLSGKSVDNEQLTKSLKEFDNPLYMFKTDYLGLTMQKVFTTLPVGFSKSIGQVFTGTKTYT